MNAVHVAVLLGGKCCDGVVIRQPFPVGRAQWDRRTLVVVDEAAMMDAKVTGEVLREARLSGAKVVLAGDDRQLGSIERGGLFTELKKEHGSSEISQVTRQKVDWQREASRDLSDGRFEDALRAFARNKAVVWTSKQDELREKLVERWAKGSASNPSASRFVFAYTNKDVDALNKDLRAVRRERGELGEDFVFTTKHGEAAFAVGDRVQFTDTLKGAGIYNGNAGTITGIDRNFGRISVSLDAAAGREGRKVEWSASEFSGFRHGYAGTIYKGQGKTLDHTYLMHTHHWRAASSYVALTRQRESATIFVATQTARDLRQLARQIGRNEIKSASVAYATKEELTVEQRGKLESSRTVEKTMPALDVSRERVGPSQAEADALGTKMDVGAFGKARDSRRDSLGQRNSGEQRPEEMTTRQAAGPQHVTPEERRAVGKVVDRQQAGANERKDEDRKLLLPSFEAVGADGIRRDSFGRALDEGSIAAAISRDADVQRERSARSIYLETAYRDPKAATQRLDEIIARDGPTSAARRLSADTCLVGELRGREGFFAGARAREERTDAQEAAAAIGPNIVRTAEYENRAAQAYRAEVEKQMKADAVEVTDVSDRAKAALGKFAMAKDDRERAEAFKVVSADQEVSREVATFRKSIEARFGEDGAREIARATASGKPFEHPSVPKSEQGRLDETAKLYSAARSGEVASRQQAETERLAERESQSTRLKQ
ncbi:AAA family ATPase [Mesorhizobium sp. M1156]|uniref:AAA family ATPase n=1 Tax=Mesorhizobium sp. M1156 TaxID=2957064 RepID=UPI00333664EA